MKNINVLYAIALLLQVYLISGLSENPSVGVHVVLDRINMPTVIKTEIIPGDIHESIFITTQPGEIWIIREGKSQKIVDISYANKGPVLKLGNVRGSADKTYDERGLLGLEFHPDFQKNGRFFIYYSTGEHPRKLMQPAVPNPCKPATQSAQWANENKYSHINVVEEWKFDSLTQIKKVRRFLSIKHPFFNHDSINNLFWSKELKRLLLLTGDGGFRDGPFNLSQDDRYLHGKVIAINTEDPAWNKYTSKPIAQFSQLPVNIAKTVRVLIKGVRNWSGLTEFYHADGNSTKFVGQPGQDNVEAVFAFNSFTQTDAIAGEQPLNFGWRAWEGGWPNAQYLDCRKKTFTMRSGPFMGTTYFHEAVALDTQRRLPYCEYFHLDKRPDKIQGMCITSQQVYRGKAIPALTDHLIVSDWAENFGNVFPTNPTKRGFLLRMPIDKNLTTLHDFDKIEIEHDFKTAAFFIVLGTNKAQDRLFLGTYETAGTTTANLGTIYEIVPMAPYLPVN